MLEKINQKFGKRNHIARGSRKETEDERAKGVAGNEHRQSVNIHANPISGWDTVIVYVDILDCEKAWKVTSTSQDVVWYLRSKSGSEK